MRSTERTTGREDHTGTHGEPGARDEPGTRNRPRTHGGRRPQDAPGIQGRPAGHDGPRTREGSRGREPRAPQGSGAPPRRRPWNRPSSRPRRRTALLAFTAAAVCAAALLGPAAGTAGSAPAPAPGPDCPGTLTCVWSPAAYALTDPGNPQSYGNYDLADRARAFPVRYIVIHNTEGSYDGTIRWFQDPAAKVSAHYVVRSRDGHVTQMVRGRDVAWQAGNWYVNAHSIGIEQEGWATEGATWYTDAMYRSTARLVKHLAAKYGVPLDRQHIIGHDVVPATVPANVRGMHWDPGPYWDWARFFRLLGRPVEATGPRRSALVTLAPAFRDNVQHVRDCEKNTDLPDQAASFVPLHTGPSAATPLFSDPGLHPDGAPGTDCAADWGSKASTGQSFVVAGREGDWTAIWWAGEKAWFRDPASGPVTVPAGGLVVRPRAGRSEVPVYGRAYPEASAYPLTVPAQSVVPLPYTIKAGQAYATSGPTPTGYYFAKTIDGSAPGDRTFVGGKDRYLTIQLGHRIAFVKAADVDVVRPGRI